MDEKKISEMTVEEILRQQMELLAETSQKCAEAFDKSTLMLPGLTEAILHIAKELTVVERPNYLPLSSSKHTAL